MFIFPFETFDNIAAARNPALAAVPFGNPPSMPADTQLTPFGFTGTPGTASFSFNHGWRLATPLGSELTDVLAMFTGALRIRRRGATLQLLLQPVAPALDFGFKHTRVEFIRLPGVVVYENLDMTEVAAQLPTLATAEPALARSSVDYANENRDAGDAYDDFTALLEDFVPPAGVDGTSPYPIVVPAGFRLGSMGPSPTTAPRREVFIALRRDPPDVDEDFWLNPSFYLAIWPEYFADVGGSIDAGHVMLRELMTVSWPFVAKGGANAFRFVRHGASGAAPFSDSAQPSATLSAAVAAADPGDTIVILDTARYVEDEIIIDKPLTITSMSARTATDDGTNAEHFPRLDGRGRHRVLRVDGNDPAGMVVLRSLTIENGAIRDDDDAHKGYFGGGGILVNGRNETIIENCIIQNNRTNFLLLPTFNVFDEVAARIDNPLLRLAIRGLLERMTAGLGSTDLRRMNDWAHVAQAFGGGISVVYASPYIRDNKLIENHARGGRGGGIGVALYSFPCIEKNHLLHNEADPGTRRDGGGIGCCIALPDRQGVNVTSRSLLNELFDYINEHVGLSDLPTSLPTSAGAELSNWIRNQLYPIVQGFVRDRAPNWFHAAQISRARFDYVRILGNTLDGNLAQDDGGGIYLSVMSRAYLAGNDIRNNRAQEGAGGGIRATMASDCFLRDNIIEGNQANALRLDTSNGGGGIGVRNVQMTIEGGRIASNVANEFAGGGIYFSASDDGGLGIQELPIFHAILTITYGFRATKLSIDGRARIQGNIATHTAFTDQGKGGGLYLFRYNVIETPTLEVEVERYRIVVTSNSASFANASDFTLTDSEVSVTTDDTSVGRHLSGANFSYRSMTFRSP